MLKAAMPTPKDAEEYYCLQQPDPDEGSSLRSSPDVMMAHKGNGECEYEDLTLTLDLNNFGSILVECVHIINQLSILVKTFLCRSQP